MTPIEIVLTIFVTVAFIVSLVSIILMYTGLPKTNKHNIEELKSKNYDNDEIHSIEPVMIRQQLDRSNSTLYLKGVPSILIQSYIHQKMPAKMFQNVQRNRNLNNDCSSLYFDDMDCNIFMNTYCKGKILDVYEKLIPGAFKCDIFRLAVLYYIGGCYMDISMKGVAKVTDIVSGILENDTSKHQMILCDDVDHMAIYQAFIITTPRNPILMKVLEKICDRILLRLNKTTDPLAVSGPIAFGQELNLILGRKKNAAYDSNIRVDNANIFIARHTPDPSDPTKSKIFSRETGEIWCYTKYDDYDKDRISGAHYSCMTKNKTVYHDYKLKSSYTDNPPKFTVFQTWPCGFVSKEAYQAFDSWKSPHWNHQIFTEYDCRESMATSYSNKQLVRIYDTVLSPVHRAQLWSLYQLYMSGGVFVDMDMQCTNQEQFVSTFKDVKDLVVVGSDYDKKRSVILAAPPKNESVKLVLKNLITQLKNNQPLDLASILGRFENIFVKCDCVQHRGLYSKENFLLLPKSFTPSKGFVRSNKLTQLIPEMGNKDLLVCTESFI